MILATVIVATMHSMIASLKTPALKSMLGNGGWVLLSQMGTAFSAFILAWILANTLSQEAFGIYRYVISLATLFVIFSLQGLGAATTQTVARGNSGQLSYIARVRMRWALLSLMAMWAIAAFYFIKEDSDLAFVFAISGLFVPFYDVFFTHYFFLQGKKNFKSGALIQVVGRAFVVVVVGAVSLIYAEALYVTVAFIVATGLYQYLGHRYTNRVLYPKDKDLPVDPDLVSYGTRLSWLGAFSIIAAQIDKVIVGAFLGFQEVALYVIAMMLPMESHRLGRIFYQIFLPRFSTLSEGEGQKKLLMSVGLLTLCSGVIFVVYYFIAEYIFLILFPTYLEAVIYTQVAMLQVFTAPAIILRAYFVGQKNDHALKLVLVYVPIVRLGIMLVGIVLGGLWGLIYGVLMGGFLEYALSFLPFFKRSNENVSNKRDQSDQ